MTSAPAIQALVDELDGPDWTQVAAQLPPGEAGSEMVGRLADEAESRIMADLARAVSTTRTLIALADARASASVRARVRRVHSQALTYSNLYDDAFATLGEALPLAQEAHDLVEVGRIRLTMLHIHARQTRFDEAVECGTLARDAFEAAHDRVLVGRAENNLGILERMRDRPRAALEHFRRAALALASQPPLLAHVENNRAEALLDLDDFSAGESAFRAALAAFRLAGAHRHAGIVLGNLADLASRQGRSHDALKLFEEARRVLGEASAPGDAARLAVEHADVLFGLGMLSQAELAYSSSIPVLEQHKMTAEMARACLGLGRVQVRRGDRTALTTLEQAQRLFAGHQNTTGRARALAIVAETRARDGDVGSALSLLDDAGTGVADRPAALAWINLLSANVYLAMGQGDRACEQTARAIQVAETLGLAPLAADLLQTQGKGLMLQGKKEPAAASLRRAVRHAERCRGAMQTDRFRSAFLGERATIWEDCATAVLDANDPGALGEAFTLVESAKSRSLLDALQNREAAAPASADDDSASALVAALAAINGELSALYARAHETGEPTPAQRERAAGEIRRRETAAEALVIRLGATSGFAGAFAAPTPLADLAALVPDTGLVLEYFAEGGHLSAFAITRRSTTTHRRFASISAVEAGVNALNFQIRRALVRGLPQGQSGERLTRDAQAELAALSSLLVAPFAGAINGATALVVIPTAPLHMVPFGALALGERRLISSVDLGLAPSASVLARMPAPRAGPALFVGVADERAPRAESEAHTIGALVPKATVMTGGLATRKAFTDRCADFSHIHFAGHARFIPSNPGASGLKLADGWLTAAEIARLNLRGASLMLSACDSGKVAVTGGDELMGLTQAALSAGAASLTTALWPVHDAQTLSLMAEAYGVMYPEPSAMGRVPSVSRALREVQCRFMNSGAHPAAWAPFVTVCSPWKA